MLLSNKSTCRLKTDCEKKNISDVEFRFVCFNPDSEMPSALHSFGRGGFASQEDFDSGVPCQRCTSIGYALQSGGPLLGRTTEMVIGSQSRQPLSSPAASSAATRVAEPSAEVSAGADTALHGNASNVEKFAPISAAYFGPQACIAAFRSEAGTCTIETRCKDVNMSDLTVGITCVDKAGGHTRYLFERDSFGREERFDTRVRCEACLGVSEEETSQGLKMLLPKGLVEDVNALRSQVRMLSKNLPASAQLASQAAVPSTASPIAKTAFLASVRQHDGAEEAVVQSAPEQDAFAPTAKVKGEREAQAQQTAQPTIKDLLRKLAIAL